MLRNHLTWVDERHSIGIDAIDDEHRHIIELVNRINDMLDKRAQYGKLLETLDELLVYTEAHFVHEEQIMVRHGYPDLPRHVDEHRKLQEQIHNLIGKARSAPSLFNIELVPAFLADWAVQHILHDDRKLGAFLASHGEAS